MRARTRCAILFLIISLAMVGVGCGSERGASEQSAPTPTSGAVKAAPHTLVLTDKDNGKRIELSPSQTVLVKLESQPGTGYAWRVSPQDQPKISLLASGTQQTTAGGPGASEVQYFELKPAANGLTTVQFEYIRVWEKSKPPSKQFSVELNVR